MGAALAGPSALFALPVPAAARNARLGLKFGGSELISHLEVSTARKAGKTSSKSSNCGTASRQHAYDRM